MIDSKTYFTENRDQQIAYRQYGLNGNETIVFLHGLTSKKEDWNSPEANKGMGVSAIYASLQDKLNPFLSLPVIETMMQRLMHDQETRMKEHMRVIYSNRISAHVQ